ncbi:MAG: hypothetical protein MPJ24_10315 [Pirellulaceae bacterium]|nr:hypothetical protein [Pirellulaceae bacterium]
MYLKKEVVKEYLAFAKVKYFGGTGEIFRSQGPSWVVGKFLGPSNLALLSPVMTLMQMISSCAMTVILPLYPLVGKLSSGKKKADFSHWIPLFTKYLLLIELVVATPLSLYSGEILQLWLGDDFVTVSFLFGVVAVVGSMISLRWVYYFMALGGAKITAIEMSTVTSAIISLVGLAIGEGFLGWGLSESVFFFLGILLLQEVVYVPWAYRNVFKYSIVKLWWSSYLWPVGVAMLTILLGHELREFFQPASWAFLLPLLFLQAAIATGVFLLFCTTKAEREEVLKLVNSLKKKK